MAFCESWQGLRIVAAQMPSVGIIPGGMAPLPAKASPMPLSKVIKPDELRTKKAMGFGSCAAWYYKINRLDIYIYVFRLEDALLAPFTQHQIDLLVRFNVLAAHMLQ